MLLRWPFVPGRPALQCRWPLATCPEQYDPRPRAGQPPKAAGSRCARPPTSVPPYTAVPTIWAIASALLGRASVRTSGGPVSRTQITHLREVMAQAKGRSLGQVVQVLPVVRRIADLEFQVRL